MSSSPYDPAAKLLNRIWKERKGLKTVAYSREGELVCSKTTYAQCANVLQHKTVLDRLLQSVTIPAKNQGLLYVLAYELLLGPNKKIRGGGGLKQALVSAEVRLNEELGRIRHEVDDNQLTPDTNPLKRVTIPRYVRVNTLRTTRDEVISKLKSKNLSIFLDAHVPDVLVMPATPETRAALQDFVTNHEIVLQDKSSCFSAMCLMYGFDTLLANAGYIDACAAPGNKTSHLASLIPRDKSKIYAFDKSSDRYEILRRRIKELAGEARVQCHNLDFFEASSNGIGSQACHFDNVQAILLDPSCSGSGMLGNHQDATRDPKFSNERIESLSEFQLQALEHATSPEKFPSVQRVVYSTCSLYLQENECVVEKFLKEHSDKWRLVAPKCLESWKRRGLQLEGLTKEQSDALIRVHPDHDASNGFFVACFEKIEQAKPSKRQRNVWEGVSAGSGSSIYRSVDDRQSHGNDTTTSLPKKRKSPESVTETEGDKPQQAPRVHHGQPSFQKGKHSNKVAKKQEWKRKQRERKEARLSSK